MGLSRLLLALVTLMTSCARTPPPPLLDAYREPRQELLQPTTLAHAGATLTLRARYDIHAHVMSTRSYDDELAAVAPLDFALAWGAAATPEVQAALKVWQSGRWYRWKASSERLDRSLASGLNQSMANVHLVPDDEDIRRQLVAVPPGATVRLLGYLVDVQHPTAGRRPTSLSRTDSGAGACEVLLVERVEVQLPA